MIGERHRLVVDRFEGDVAVVEVDGARFVDLPCWLLPEGTREDDVLIATAREATEGAVVWEIRIDAEATAAARAEARALVERLRRRDPGGDIAL